MLSANEFFQALERHGGVLSIFLTNRCNARCDHCATNSGPRVAETRKLDEIIASLRVWDPDFTEFIHVSGGEPFVEIDPLREISKICEIKQVGLTVNTNGFWGSSRVQAEKTLMSVSALTHLIFSTSVFHQKYVPLFRLRNAISAAKARGIYVILTIAKKQGEQIPNEFLDEIGRETLDGVLLGSHDIQPTGRARFIAKDYVPNDRGQSGCALLNRPVILQNGRVLACCNTPVASALNSSPLDLGDVTAQSLASCLTKSQVSRLLRVIKVYGPHCLIETLKARGFQIPDNILSADRCRKCAFVLGNEAFVSALKQEITDTIEENASVIHQTMGD